MRQCQPRRDIEPPISPERHRRRRQQPRQIRPAPIDPAGQRPIRRHLAGERAAQPLHRPLPVHGEIEPGGTIGSGACQPRGHVPGLAGEAGGAGGGIAAGVQRAEGGIDPINGDLPQRHAAPFDASGDLRQPVRRAKLQALGVQRPGQPDIRPDDHQFLRIHLTAQQRAERQAEPQFSDGDGHAIPGIGQCDARGGEGRLGQQREAQSAIDVHLPPQPVRHQLGECGAVTVPVQHRRHNERRQTRQAQQHAQHDAERLHGCTP